MKDERLKDKAWRKRVGFDNIAKPKRKRNGK